MERPAGWNDSADGTALERCFRFADFTAAFAFLTRVADHSERVGHHPDFCLRWNRVDLRLTSHDTGAVTARDVALAKAIDRLARNDR